jgi:hypothetical protein
MKKVHFIHNHKFGKLTAVSISHFSGTITHWNVVCECGNKRIVGLNNLRSGRTSSCGDCSRGVNNRTHGMAHTLEYKEWLRIRKSPSTCPEWKVSFLTFYGDIGAAPQGIHRVTKINLSRAYNKNNCEWKPLAPLPTI